MIERVKRKVNILLFGCDHPEEYRKEGARLFSYRERKYIIYKKCERCGKNLETEFCGIEEFQHD